MKLHTLTREIIIVGCLCLFLYVFRIIYADFIWGGGGDFPDVIMFGLRLYDTSPFKPLFQQDNTFFNILTFSRGYSRNVLPFLTYYAFFELLGITITEKAFVSINALWGIVSLLGIYYFCRQFLSENRRYIALFLIGLAPTLLNYNRSFIAPYSIEMTFYYLGLAFLYQYAATNHNKWRIAYACATAIFLGAGNTVFIEVVLQMVFFVCCQADKNLKDRILALLRFLWHWSILVFVAAPTAGILYLGFFFYRNGLRYGQLMHIFMKDDVNSILHLAAFPIVPFLANLLLIVGPAIVIFPYAIFWGLKRHRELPAKYVLLYLLGHAVLFSFLVIASNRPGFWYAIMIVPGVIIIASVPTGRFYRFALVAVMLITPFWTYYLNYDNSSPRGFFGYAAGFYTKRESNSGLKTLAYLVRTNRLPVSQNDPKRIGVFMDFEGAWFYLGFKIHDWVVEDLEARQHEQYEQYLVVYRVGRDTPRNQFIKDYVDTHPLHHIGSIVDETTPLMEIYANYERPYTQYAAQDFDGQFDQQFGNIQSYAKYWLGGN